MSVIEPAQPDPHTDIGRTWLLRSVLAALAATFAIAAFGLASIEGTGMAIGIPTHEAASALLSAAALHLAAVHVIELR